MSLIDARDVVGVFRGFAHGGLEFHADLVLPYRDEFQSQAMHGQFVLVQLEHADEAVLGRITMIVSQGRLVTPTGEDYAIRAAHEGRPIPEELRDQYLRYKVDIRMLGVLRHEGERVHFVPSHRRLPHVGARVAIPSAALLVEIAGAGSAEADADAAELGFLAFGEFVYAGDDPRCPAEPWMMVKEPAIVPRFRVQQLVSRRSFVFARAGFGKSNLIKLLFSRLYATAPTVVKRDGRRVPVGTVIFDPDGEYFWPDDKGRPGLCDVPELRDELVVFTDRYGPSAAYQSFVVDRVKLDIRELRPSRVLGVALSADRQDQQNVNKLKGLAPERWRELVDLVHANRHGIDPAAVRTLLGLPDKEEAQTHAAIGNMVRVVDALHDPASQMLTALKRALADGKLCVVDISRLRGAQGMQLAGTVLNHIFEHNQEQFTRAASRTIPTIAVIEEAQSVLSARAASDDDPFVSWVKEGRKYDLGAVLVTQQPGSLPHELLSQGDNFFVFHLLSAGDLTALKNANAHFSEDLLASLLNEPLVGHGVFWSSAGTAEDGPRPYPLPVRVLSFESAVPTLLDGDYAGAALDTYAGRLRKRYQKIAADAGGDVQEALRAAAIRRLKDTGEFWAQLQSAEGIKWGIVQKMLSQGAPDDVAEPFEWAKDLVVPALNKLIGPGRWGSEPRPDPRGGRRTWIVLNR